MDKLQICKDWADKFVTFPFSYVTDKVWLDLLDRLAGSPHDRDPHHEMCLIGLGHGRDCSHCRELHRKDEKDGKFDRSPYKERS